MACVHFALFQVFEISPSLYVVELRKSSGDSSIYRQVGNHLLLLQSLVWAFSFSYPSVGLMRTLSSTSAAMQAVVEWAWCSPSPARDLGLRVVKWRWNYGEEIAFIIYGLFPFFYVANCEYPAEKEAVGRAVNSFAFLLRGISRVSG